MHDGGLRTKVRRLLVASFAHEPEAWGHVIVLPHSKGARVVLRESLADELLRRGLPALAVEVLERDVPPGCTLVLQVVDGACAATLRLELVDLRGGP